eukprot:CAMPEP_0194332818 /NCGR_PEP_ID=MMETSP0171-20130528/60472_1 /TAXON_ID=218684 /ORGANISM="Corethron pennatum, Strain L29A3" /LENGTH=37 /DNA_ID= /DNA_START= /DNA_END= /DNA_ORIENTATION=
MTKVGLAYVRLASNDKGGTGNIVISTSEEFIWRLLDV